MIYTSQGGQTGGRSVGAGNNIILRNGAWHPPDSCRISLVCASSADIARLIDSGAPRDAREIYGVVADSVRLRVRRDAAH